MMRYLTAKFLSIVSCIVLFFLLCSELNLGFIGPRPVLAFSVGEEKEVGEQLLNLVRKEFTLLDDPDLVQYITKLGNVVLKEAGTQYFDYHFFVIKDKTLNAFAAPSGLIFVNSGLIDTINSENELLGVIAHECGHVVSRHIANRMEKGTAIGIGTMALVLAGALIGAGAASEALIAGSMAANASLSLKFSRQDEEEADRLGFKWMQEADRDPEAMLATMRIMRNMKMMTTGDKIPGYLLTHPEPEARMGYIQDMLAMYSRGHQYKTVDDFEFRRLKFRIFSLTRDQKALLAHFQKEIFSTTNAPKDRTMAKYGLSQAYLADGSYGRAISTLQEVVNLMPDRPILRADLGVALFNAGRLAEAKEILESVRTQDPDCGYATFYLAQTHQQMGDLTRALTMYQQLLPILPDNARLLFLLGDVYSRQGKIGLSSYYLGIYNLMMGDAKNAKYHLERAVQELPVGDSLREQAVARLKKIEEQLHTRL